MSTFSMQMIGFFWIFFVVFWFVSAIGVKKSHRKTFMWAGAAIRIAAILLALLLFRSQVLRHISQEMLFASSLQNQIIGMVLCAVGIGFAIWARVHIGRNWGMPMTVKETPELITSGPYTIVRHPIYTGVGLALLGSALAAGILWFIPFAASCVYFIVSAKIEEKNLTREFPKEYPSYSKKTKMLIPFIY